MLTSAMPASVLEKSLRRGTFRFVKIPYGLQHGEHGREPSVHAISRRSSHRRSRARTCAPAMPVGVEPSGMTAATGTSQHRAFIRQLARGGSDARASSKVRAPIG